MRLSTTCEELAAYQISVLVVSVRVRLEHVLMEFVAQLVECQNVDLMVAGSNPVKLPKMAG